MSVELGDVVVIVEMMAVVYVVEEVVLEEIVEIVIFAEVGLREDLVVEVAKIVVVEGMIEVKLVV
jgi:hypothetical protein